MHDVSGHSDQNGHAFMGTKNGIHGEENGSNGTLDMHDSSCQMDENGHGVLDRKDVIFREQNVSNGTLDTHGM